MARIPRRLPRFFLRLVLRLLLYSLLAACLLTTAGVWCLDHYFQPERIKPELTQALSDFLQRPVSIASISWQWYPRPILFGAEVSVKEDDGRPLLDAPEVRVYPNLKQLLRRRIFIQGLGIHGPDLTLRRYADGSTNIGKAYSDIAGHLQSSNAGESSSLSFVLRSIRVSGGRLKLSDEGLHPGPLRTDLTLAGSFDFPEDETPVTMQLRSDVVRGAERGHLILTGSFGSRTVIEAASQDLPLQAAADYAEALRGIDARAALTASVVITSSATRWAIDGRVPARRIFPLLTRPALTVEFKLRSDEPSSVKALVALEKTSGEITASTPHLARPELKAHALFSRLDVEEVLATLRALRPAAPPAAVKTVPEKPFPWSLAADLAVRRGSYRGGSVDDLTALVYRGEDGAWRAEAMTPSLAVHGESFSLSTAAVSFQDGDLEISHLGFSGLGGRGTLDLSLAPLDRFDVSWAVSEIDSARLQDLLGLRPLTTGRLGSTGRLSGDRNDPKSTMLQGAFQMGLSSGVVSGLPGVVKFLSSLNVKTLFKTVEGKNVRGLPFRVVSASCTVDAGILRTAAPLALHSDTMDMGLLGSVDLAKGTIQADLVVQFRTVINEVIRLIPGVKQILIGKKMSMLPLWVKISGPLADPEVRIQPVKSLEKKLWSTVKGVFTLPEDVFSAVTRVGRGK